MVDADLTTSIAAPDADGTLLDAIDALDRAAGFLTAISHLLSLADRGDEIAQSAGWNVGEVFASVDKARDILAKINERRR